MAGLCDEVHLLTCLGGDDSHEAFIRERLRPNVTPCFLVREAAPTITKRRYVTEGALRKMSGNRSFADRASVERFVRALLA